MSDTPSAQRARTPWLLGLLAIVTITLVAVLMWSQGQPTSPGRPVEVGAHELESSTNPTTPSVPSIEGPPLEPLAAPDTTQARIRSSNGSIPESATIVIAASADGDAPGSAWPADDDGVVRIPMRSATAGSWTARAPGFTPAVLSIAEVRQRAEQTGRVEIILDPLGSLAGTVQWTDGRPAVGVTVLGWPRTAFPSLADVFAALTSEPGPTGGGLLSATSDDGGRFVLSGAEPDRTYLLTAGAAGVLGGWGLASVSDSPRRATRLTVKAHYAVLVERRDEHGALLPPPSASFGSDHIARLADGHAESVILDPIHLALLGLSSPGWDPGSSGVLVGFTTERDAAAVGPLVFHANQPGFVSQRAEFAVPRTTHGLQVVTITMQPAAEPGGRVYVELVGAQSGATAAVAFGDDRMPRLRLQHKGTGRVTDCPLRVAGEGPLLLDGVPFGPYEATLLTRHDLARLQPEGSREIVVGPTPATLIFDLRSLGRLEIILEDDVARLVAARAMFNVASTSAPALNSWTAFGSPPYVLEGLTPGEYTILLYALDEPDGTGARMVRATVAAGEDTWVSISNAATHETPFAIPGMQR